MKRRLNRIGVPAYKRRRSAREIAKAEGRFGAEWWGRLTMRVRLMRGQAGGNA